MESQPIYYIRPLDDGNQRFAHKPNQWTILSTERDQCELLHVDKVTRTWCLKRKVKPYKLPTADEMFAWVGI